MHRYTVELRIVGEELAHDEVTRALGVEPTQVRKKGEHRSEKSVWSENMWCFEIRPVNQRDWLSLEDGLAALIERFIPMRKRLESHLPANKIFIWCGHFTSSFDGGPTFSPQLLRSLGELGVELVLDTFCEGGLVQE